MVYIRSKKIKGESYLYLVKSVWDKKNSTSKQELIKYLGNATDVTSNDITNRFEVQWAGLDWPNNLAKPLSVFDGVGNARRI